MTIFIRLIDEPNKIDALQSACKAARENIASPYNFLVSPQVFRVIPGAPFAYWASQDVRNCFSQHPPFESNGRFALGGLKTLSDERFLRVWWEVIISKNVWVSLAKGGKFSAYYGEINLVVNWTHKGGDISWYGYQRRPREGFGASSRGVEAYLRPGLTWARRTQGGLSLRPMPRGCIFADKGPAAFVSDDSPDDLLPLLAVVNSQAFSRLVSLQMAFGSYEVGVIQRTPIPNLPAEMKEKLAALAKRAWSLKRMLASVDETSHAFQLPSVLRARKGDWEPLDIEADLARTQAEVDAIAFEIYGFNKADREATQTYLGATMDDAAGIVDVPEIDADDDDGESAVNQTDGLLSWAAGVAFGRFDWRLASGTRAFPTGPEPFDPLPTKSPGMLPDDADPFHLYAGIMVDDPGHPHDLSHLLEEVLMRVEAPVALDIRRWLQRDFFPLHLQRYSKSRRKAPIYWPLATVSSSYTVWLYYPSLTSQTLYIAVNDFLEPKLLQIAQQTAALRSRADARTREEDRSLEALQTLEAELVELRDVLLRIAPTYRPSQDDGVQITAAPLWPLFRHRPWQKLLKDTWVKLEKGEYDWAHLAMAYWPDRVREKCKADKSLAIAHDLEHLYVPPEPKVAKPRGRKKASEA